MMLFLSKHILAVVISAITLVSGSGFTTLKMVCLCSGDVTLSIFDKEACEEPKQIKDIPVIDHKCCSYSEASLKLHATTVNVLDGLFVKNFDFISFPVLVLFSRTFIEKVETNNTKDFIPLLQSCSEKIFTLNQNFRI